MKKKIIEDCGNFYEDSLKKINTNRKIITNEYLMCRLGRILFCAKNILTLKATQENIERSVLNAGIFFSLLEFINHNVNTIVKYIANHKRGVIVSL